MYVGRVLSARVQKCGAWEGANGLGFVIDT